MKTKITIVFSMLLIALAVFTSCNKEPIKQPPTLPTDEVAPLSIPKCCEHKHYVWSEVQQRYIYYHCCCCICVGEEGMMTNGDTLTAQDVIDGATIDYYNPDWTLAYSYQSDELGHWAEDADDPIANREYNIVARKTGYVSDTIMELVFTTNNHPDIQPRLAKQ
jgi:hypothetical protein